LAYAVRRDSGFVFSACQVGFGFDWQALTNRNGPD